MIFFFFFAYKVTNLIVIPLFVGVVADWVRPAITPFHPTIDGLMVRHLKNVCLFSEGPLKKWTEHFKLAIST